MAEFPTQSQISTEPKEYDQKAGESLAKWCHELVEYAHSARKKNTNEDNWDSDFEFLKGNQWSGPLPSYRRAIVMNAWKRALHMALAIIIGNRPILKLVPEGNIPSEVLKPWQDGFWSIQKREHVIEKYADALCWSWMQDGSWFKVGYGKRDETGDDFPDVLVASPHPKKIFPDPDCTDYRLVECGYIAYRDTLDMSTISKRYPQQARIVTPDRSVSTSWGNEDVPDWATSPNVDTIAPAGNWKPTGEYRRARATIVELSIDDSTLEQKTKQEIVNTKDMQAAWDNLTEIANGRIAPMQISALATEVMKLNTDSSIQAVNELRQQIAGLGMPDVVPEVRSRPYYVPKYPYGRLITCTKTVVLRDIPNPLGKALGWEQRYPFVYMPGAFFPNTLWRPGLLSNQKEMQIAINKTLSLLVENSIKVTNAMVIADDNALEDEDWDVLSLFPGVKIRKRPYSDFRVDFPRPLPPQAFQLPDYLIRKLEENVGLHDPPIAPGQSVSAKTVTFMQQKGSFLMGVLAHLAENALERLGSRMIGIMVDRYLPNRPVPLFEGERIVGIQNLPSIPPSARFRVEATSGIQEIFAVMQQMSDVEAKVAAKRR